MGAVSAIFVVCQWLPVLSCLPWMSLRRMLMSSMVKGWIVMSAPQPLHGLSMNADGGMLTPRM